MSRPKVLHVAAVEFTATRLLEPQMKALKRAGFDVRLACAPASATFAEILDPYVPTRIDFPRSAKPWPMVSASIALTRLVRELQPEILHLHTPAAALPIRMIPRWMLGSKTALVYTVHGFPFTWDLSSRRARILERLERRLARRTDLLLFQSQEDYSESSDRKYRSSLKFLGNGVQDDWYGLRPPTRSRPLRVLYVGRLVREKGVLDLVEAMKHVPEAHLSLAGIALDSDRDSVEADVRRAADAMPHRFTMLGFQPPEILKRTMEAHDIMVLPSYREGVPRSVIEALAAARPVLGTNIRGTRELVVDGVNGYLVPAGDVDGLAQGIRRFTTISDHAYSQMSAAARSSVENRRESKVFERLIDAYSALGVRV